MDLKKLCEINAVSGNEQHIRSVILKEASAIDGVTAEIDRVGNVVCRKKCGRENAKNVLVASPMDEIGFMVLSSTKDGFLRLMPVGKIGSRVAVSKRISIGKENVKAVIGSKPIHLQSADERKHVLSWEELYADIGAKDDEEALEKAPKGSYASFDMPFMTFGDGYVSGKALSGRSACHNLLRLLQSDTKNDVTAVFTTLRQGDSRGAEVLSYTHKPDYAIALSACVSNDMGGQEETSHVSEIGKGAAVIAMDKGAVASRQLFRDVCRLADENGKTYQIARGLSPKSEAGTLQHSSWPVSAIALSIPCRNLNSPCEIMKISDIDSQLELTIDVINNL